MTEESENQPKALPLLSPRLTDATILEEIGQTLADFWLPPHEARARIEAFLTRSLGNSCGPIVVSGETTNVAVYVLGNDGVLAITPFSTIAANVLLQDVYGMDVLPRDATWHKFPPDKKLFDRLVFPTVLLVNPCVLENFPVPRLSLNVGLLAAYLRQNQKADVSIIDMQMGTTVNEIESKLIALKPDLLGMSISYGQKHLAFSILDRAYAAMRSGKISTMVVLGNIIPASFPEEFLLAYPGSIVALAEGEETIIGLVDYLNGKRALTDVPAIAYRDPAEFVKRTSNVPVPIHKIPLPALDTVADLSRCRGALTLELSRGCQWNVCTFCPREHKSYNWKAFTNDQVLTQFMQLRQVVDQFGLAAHVFLADEEFIGSMNDGMETLRITELMQRLIETGAGMSFDAAVRVDQVFNPRMSRDWHVDRIRMWHLCRRAGLDRLFMGLESGSDSQLNRYGKGIRAEDSIMAIRILSALGIKLRFGFITFDPLMVGLNEIKQNIAFMERKDAFMKALNVEQYGYDCLFDLLITDSKFVKRNVAEIPIYASVSYMLASLEVLINSRYKIMLNQAEHRYQRKLLLNPDKPDTNMGRYEVEFLDPLVGDISMCCQKWIDHHFGLAYSVKSLYKVAPRNERSYLMSWMIGYRYISLLLLKALVYIFEEGKETQHDRAPVAGVEDEFLGVTVEQLRGQVMSGDYACRARIIEACMNAFDRLVRARNEELLALLVAGKIRDTEDARLHLALVSWMNSVGRWSLINSSTD